MEKIKILIADDVKILRQGLKAILSHDETLEVVATAENGKEAFEKCTVFKPDVVLMDMRMPEFDGAYGIAAIKEQLPETKVLVLTTFDDEETVNKAVESGADGYILKEMEDEKVIASVKSVYQGISVFGTGVFQSMRGRMLSAAEQTAREALMGEGQALAKQKQEFFSMKSRQPISFTQKELELLSLVAEGYDNKEIAASLCIAEGTARNNVSKLLDKVEAKDRTQLAVYAVKQGLDTSL